jgi:hypothetical protein
MLKNERKNKAKNRVTFMAKILINHSGLIARVKVAIVILVNCMSFLNELIQWYFSWYYFIPFEDKLGLPGALT